jgi:hypothetical protein
MLMLAVPIITFAISASIGATTFLAEAQHIAPQAQNSNVTNNTDSAQGTPKQLQRPHLSIRPRHNHLLQ